MQQELIITPVTPLVNLGTLVDAFVQAEVFDDPLYRRERYLGTIDEVKITRRGTFVHFHTPALVGAKWIPLHKVKGFAWMDTQKAAV